jgi:energy-coupling factor transport system ATP-binding protein
MNNENIIEAQSVSFSYSSEEENINALNDINISVKKGEFLALLGHNGSGKSTIAKHFNAVLLPSGGRVFVKGMDTENEELTTEIRRTVGMVFQNPDNQLVATIVEEDVAFGPENLGVEPTEIRRRVDDALRAVDMYEYRLHAPHRLSGGQKQRIAIAGIIAMQPDCIVFDEPTAMLDPRGRAEVMDTITSLCREKGITVVLITHYMDEACRADRVLVINNGAILTEGTPKEVFSQIGLLRAHGLDVPQATELADFIRESGYDMPKGVLSTEECVDEIDRIVKAMRDA